MESSYFGVVELTSLENIFPTNKELKKEINLMEESGIKLVHYSDCQQLIIWLPNDWRGYVDMEVKDLLSGETIWRKEISEIISGSIKIILDTLPFPPGDLSIIISGNDSIQHVINIKKYEEGVIPEIPEILPEIKPDYDKPPIIYRDGFGNIIPDQDLIMRGKVLNDLDRKFSRKVKYEDEGRSGTVIFIDGDKTLRFYSEMGGGNCIFYINIPPKEHWIKETGYSLEERDEIIKFVAESALRDQAGSSGAYFEIEDKWITFFYGTKR
ncbi:MAG TPA: hypothetical protein PLZ32_09800 [Saprospiraceae bacterium]|nr:hypothetical protein [Saprospiraceae bacterium]